MTTERDESTDETLDAPLEAVEDAPEAKAFEDPAGALESTADVQVEELAAEVSAGVRVEETARVLAEESTRAPVTEQVAAASTATPDIVPRRRWLGFRSRWALGFSILAMLVVLGASGISVAAIQYARHYDGKIMPGATIAGVDVGGLSKAEALAKVRAAVRPELQRDFKIWWQSKRWSATPAEMGARSDARRAVEEALFASANASFVDKVRMRLGGDLEFERGVAIRYPKGGVEGFVQGLASSLDQEPVDAHIDYSDTWVTVVPDELGREVNVDASTSKLLHALRNGATSTGLEVRTKKPEVTEDQFDKVLLLHIGENKLYLYENGKITHTYTVATGQSAYPTPQGEFEVVNKRYMPTWVNPAPEGWGSDMPASIPPGPGNPLGVRAIDWSASGIRFHSTSDLGSIGHNASHGCVRMTAPDVIELYDIVDIGTPIVSIQTAPYS
jgi:hypothetical protein